MVSAAGSHTVNMLSREPPLPSGCEFPFQCSGGGVHCIKIGVITQKKIPAPSATAGEEGIRPSVLNFHFSAPVARSSA